MKLSKLFRSNSHGLQKKNEAEIIFWRQEIEKYVQWYAGSGGPLYGNRPPTDAEKVIVRSPRDSAVLTWHKLHQMPKYLFDLGLSSDAFAGESVLDIGSGPMPSGEVFQGCRVYSLDPLWSDYVAAGFPLHYYSRSQFVSAPAEDIPLASGSVDAVISVNAIDHVNDFQATAKEISRVLKPGGKVALHIHYHQATDAEPIELNDEIVRDAFSWCSRLAKIDEKVTKFGWTAEDGKYALWRNF
jgi:SAM-dependent methyltransferase